MYYRRRRPSLIWMLFVLWAYILRAVVMLLFFALKTIAVTIFAILNFIARLIANGIDANNRRIIRNHDQQVREAEDHLRALLGER